MRDITIVIEQIVSILQTQSIDTTKLEKIKFDAGFRAPELASMAWEELSGHLGDLVAGGVIPAPTPEAPLWLRKIVCLIQDKAVPAE